MNKIYLGLLISLLSTAIQAQSVKLEWARSVGANSIEFGYSITTDALGNVYTFGFYNGTVDFDPGANIFNLTSNGGTEIFIQKLDRSGNFIWAKSVGGPINDRGKSITADASGNVYITGYFEGTVDFDPSANNFNLTSNGLTDIFIQKLDSSGNFIWAKSIGGTNWDHGESITIDENVYVTGDYVGTVDFDPNVDTFNLTSNSFSNAFVMKLDTGGNFIWAKSIGGISGAAYGRSITTDENVYVTGNYSFTADFDPGVDTFNLTSNGGNDVFIQKLDSSGNFIWAKSMGGIGGDYGRSISTDGNVYVTGYYEGTTDFDPGVDNFNLTSKGDADIFVQKLDTGGNFIWAKSMGGTGYDNANSITSNGNVYITGHFQGTADFDPSANNYELTANGGYDIFVQKLDSSGNFKWAASMGSNAGLSDDIGYSITTDTAGNVYVTGRYWGTVDFDPSLNTFNLTSNGDRDVFILKLGQCPINSETDVISACDSYTWIDGNTYTASTNSASYTLTNAEGCDSIIILDLTIVNSITATDFQTACNTYDWIDGNTYTSTSNTVTFNIAGGATNGCDSIVTLDLTINRVDATVEATVTSITANASAASYQWLDCRNGKNVIPGETAQSFTATTVNGNYAVEVTEKACTDTSECVTINNSVAIPNAFTPNGDGINDLFYITGGKEIKIFRLSIYDRWGNEVFKTTDIGMSWDGTYKGEQQKSEIFIVNVDVVFTNGHTVNKKQRLLLIR